MSEWLKEHAWKALRWSNVETYRNTVSAVPSMTWHREDVSRCFPVSDGVCRRYARNELIGQRVELLVPEGLRLTHTSHRRAYVSAPRARPMGADMELRARRKDGTEFPVDISISPVTTGQQLHVICTIRDISERKRSEDALRESEARYRSLVQSATYGVYQTTVDGRLVLVNPSLVAILGFESDRELLGMNARDLYVDPTDRDRLIEEYRTSRLIRGVQTRWKRRDGTPVTVKLSGRVLRNTDDEPTGFEMIAEDVTDRQLLEERLRMAEKLEAVGRLTAGVAHHFNNLLAVVVGRLELVRTVVGQESPAHGDLTAALDALRQATVLIRQMQDFGQLSEAAPVPLNLNHVLHDLIPLLRREATDRVRIVPQLCEQLPNVLMDRTHFEGITVSLVANARDAMPDGGTLTFTTEYDAMAGRVRFTARDSGVGMDEPTRVRAFDPFFTTREIGQGRGWDSQWCTDSYQGAGARFARRARSIRVRPSSWSGPRSQKPTDDCSVAD
jgi:PAS domain S-box-containing protein